MNCLKTTLFATLALGAAAFASCGDKNPTVAVTGVEITSAPSPLVLAVGGATGKVKAKVLPADATNQGVLLSVDKTGVIDIAADGTITPVATGTAIIVAYALEDQKIYETCPVTVNYQQNNVQIELTVNEDGTAADMLMKQAKFAENMPRAMDITVPGVTVVKTTEGYTISGEGIVPTTVMGGQSVAVEAYTMTEFTGTVTATSMSFEMMCGPFPLKYEGTREAASVDDAGAYTGTYTVGPEVTE